MKANPNQRSLAGLRVLVGRARHQASALSAGLRKLGADVIEIPFIEIRQPRSYKPLDSGLKHLDEYDWLVLDPSLSTARTRSGSGRRNSAGRKTIPAFADCRHCPATSKAIKKHGLKPMYSGRVRGRWCVEKSPREKIKNKRVLLARARVARDVIPRELPQAGSTGGRRRSLPDGHPQIFPLRLRAVLKDPECRPDVITFTSSSTVTNFVLALFRLCVRVAR